MLMLQHILIHYCGESTTVTQLTVVIFPPHLYFELLEGLTLHGVPLNSSLYNMHSLARIQGYQSGFKICLISSELMISHVKHEKYLYVAWCYDSQ